MLKHDLRCPLQSYLWQNSTSFVALFPAEPKNDDFSINSMFSLHAVTSHMLFRFSDDQLVAASQFA